MSALSATARLPVEPRPTIRVVAAVLSDPGGRVLITQRPAGKAYAGQWEFPGGKVEPGEAAEAALRRELREELGIRVAACLPLLTLRHDYPERQVELLVWTVEHYAGVVQGLEGQALRWLQVAELRAIDMLPADLPIIERLESSLKD
jgi:8-oxo-dGTP diphosphatase